MQTWQFRQRNQAKSNATIWDWVMTSDSHQAVFLNSKAFSNNQSPCDVVNTLKELLAFLAGQGTVDPPVERHKVLHPRPTHTLPT